MYIAKNTIKKHLCKEVMRMYETWFGFLIISGICVIGGTSYYIWNNFIRKQKTSVAKSNVNE